MARTSRRCSWRRCRPISNGSKNTSAANRRAPGNDMPAHTQISKSSLPVFPVRHIGEQEALEYLPMIRSEQMHKLMHYHVLTQWLGNLKQLRVERQAPCR